MNWQEKFKDSSTNVGFLLTLSKNQVKVLFDIDNDTKDAFPNIASYRALHRKGLIEDIEGHFNDCAPHCRLTPAGKQVLMLLIFCK